MLLFRQVVSEPLVAVLGVWRLTEVLFCGVCLMVRMAAISMKIEKSIWSCRLGVSSKFDVGAMDGNNTKLVLHGKSQHGLDLLHVLIC
ncbi:unnamed protein product [Linum trigynum]|uniref:Uncharacterized protein n=1 Tax=Linum trigynum TaxID=586398 RepID=A0AAV2DZ45_9ROSI